MPAAAFLAQATDKTGRDSRSRIHVGEYIEHKGVVTYLHVDGRRIRFTRDNVRGFAEGFNRAKNITNVGEVQALKQNRGQLLAFAKRFPTAQPQVMEEVRALDAALERLSKGQYYLDRRWIDPSSSEPAPKKALPGPGSREQVDVTVGREKLENCTVKISDAVRGIVSIVHKRGVKKYPARRLPDSLFALLPTDSEEEKEFVKQALRHRYMAEEAVQKEIAEKVVEMEAAAEVRKVKARALQLEKIRGPIANQKQRTPVSLARAIIDYKTYKKEPHQDVFPQDIVALIGKPDSTSDGRRFVGKAGWEYFFIYYYEDFYHDPDRGVNKDLELVFDRTTKHLAFVNDIVGEETSWRSLIYEAAERKR